MPATSVQGKGAKEQPWRLRTPPGTSEYEAYKDEALNPPALVVKVGKTELRYRLRSLDDLHAMLKKHGDWMLLGSADELNPLLEERSRRGDVRRRTPSGGGTG